MFKLWAKIKYKKWNLRDYLLIIFILIFSLFLFIIGVVNEKDYKNLVIIRKSGSIKKYNLDKNREIDIGSHLVQIKNKKVRVVNAKCPLKLCEKQGWIKDGQIICVPQKVVVSVYSKKDDKKIDVMVE
ncbi:MAG TPA: NusG domain II-containing protein [Candidatus Mcinerneyibacterium sp.]|nr:NusG domain II-containing protein [Candidatus Mcinerneyibacterium sp.]